jgi:FKBP-type peptidyl-prolyl cis-trans isomerase 2
MSTSLKKVFCTQNLLECCKVIAGWERGMEGACAGEKITLIVPPELAYGDSPSDKVSSPKETVHNEFSQHIYYFSYDYML